MKPAPTRFSLWTVPQDYFERRCRRTTYFASYLGKKGHHTGERASLMFVALLLPTVRGFDVDDVQEPSADKEGEQGVDDGVR